MNTTFNKIIWGFEMDLETRVSNLVSFLLKGKPLWFEFFQEFKCRHNHHKLKMAVLQYWMDEVFAPPSHYFSLVGRGRSNPSHRCRYLAWNRDSESPFNPIWLDEIFREI